MTPDDQQPPPPADTQPGWEPIPPLFPTLPVTLGDYTLTHLLGCQPDSDFYVARQSHVSRRVGLEVLRPRDEDDYAARSAIFLNHARARVAARLPHTADVLESGTSPEGYCYICQDLPQGHTLVSMAAQGYTLTVQQACSLVLAAGEMYAACAEAGLAAAPLYAETIFLNRAGEFNVLSPVLSGQGNAESTFRQTQGLATAIRSVQPTNVPGQTRLETLLSWMEYGYEGRILEWSTICETATTIIEQLKPDSALQVSRPEAYDQGRFEREGKRRRKEGRRRTGLLGLAAATVLAMGGAGIMLAPQSPEMLSPVSGNHAYCKVGEDIVKVLANPVSIAEYQRFLEEYPLLDHGRQGSITTNIPPAESDPKPTDWEAMLTAAEQEGEWQGRQLTPDSPVTNVSYWQALMYSRYMKGKLPSAPLLAAVQNETGHSGIEEWTRDTRPELQPYAKSHIVLPAEQGASPIPENNPGTRTPQRGFRLCP